MKGKKKRKILSLSIIGLMLTLIILSTYKTTIYAWDIPEKTGYHIVDRKDNCKSYQTTESVTHTISQYAAWTEAGTCGACHRPATIHYENFGYNCGGWQFTGGHTWFPPQKYSDGYSCGGRQNPYEGKCSGTYTHNHTVTHYYCGGHYVANTYTVYYKTNASDSSGEASYKATYDTPFSLHNGNGFNRSRTIHFNDMGATSKNGSTNGGKTSITCYAHIQGWDKGGLGETKAWNFTSTNGGSYTLYAQWSDFDRGTVPSISKPGYILLGYTTDSSKAGVKMDGSTTDVQVRVGDSIYPSSQNLTYYAIWKPMEYNIAFDGNGAKYDTTHTTTISGKNFNEFYQSTTDNTTVTGSVATIKNVKVDGSFTLPQNGFTKIGKGYYGQNLNYNFVGWSMSPYSSYNSNSRYTTDLNRRFNNPNYYGYYSKTSLLNLAYGSYLGNKNTNAIYFYAGETIKNWMYNGGVRQYNLAINSNATAYLYADWIPENQRPYTYFSLATKQYNTDGTWNGDIQNIAYDSNPASIYKYDNNKTIVYDDMPIYLNTTYYDPEGRVDFTQFYMEYQYSIDNGATWYKLEPNITTPNFTTKLVTMENTKLNNSKSLNDTYVLDTTKAQNYIYGYNQTNTNTETYMLEIKFTSEDGGKTTLIRNRAADTVDYPITYTNVTRDEKNNTITSKTDKTLQKPLWSTGYYRKSYTTSVQGVNVDEYIGSANSWNGQKAFTQNTAVGKTSGDNAGWYTKTIVCYAGNTGEIDADLDNLSGMTYPMYDWTNNKSYLLISREAEWEIIEQYGSINVLNTLKFRGYVKTLDNGTKVDWASKYSGITTLIREELSDKSIDNNLHKKYVDDISGDESIGFFNLSVDKDSYKHYDITANPTYSIDNTYPNKYFHTGNNKTNVEYDNQFSLYWIAIYDPNGNEVLTQTGGTTPAAFDANGIPVNGTLYTMTKARTGLPNDLTGHVYTSYENMRNDIYNKTKGLFNEYSDMLNGKYTIYFGVCDKSWNLYSPNKWAIEKSILEISPRLSFYDIGITDFKQTGYKNEDKVQTLWLRTDASNKIVTATSNQRTYTFPIYKLSGLTTSQTINGYKIYVNNYNLKPIEQMYQLNTNYVLENSLGYKVNPLYKVKAGYNFKINTNIQGADYSEITIYDVTDPTKPIQVIQKDFDEILNKNDTNTLMCYTKRQNGESAYEICFPEQTTVGSKYYVTLTVTKTTLTNTTHPTSATNQGTTTLTRTFQLGSPTNPLFEIEDTMLEDVGIELSN